MRNHLKIITTMFLVLGIVQLFAAEKDFKKDYGNVNKITATISTHEGEMEFDLLFDKAPNTVANFVDLANKGFYDSLSFHHVIDGFMTEGGDPSGDGTGGPGYTIKTEKNDLKHEAGVLVLSSSEPNTGGSRFYITHMPQPYLDGRSTVFGKITKGFDVLVRIEKGDPILAVKIKELTK